MCAIGDMKQLFSLRTFWFDSIGLDWAKMNLKFNHSVRLKSIQRNENDWVVIETDMWYTNKWFIWNSKIRREKNGQNSLTHYYWQCNVLLLDYLSTLCFPLCLNDANIFFLFLKFFFREKKMNEQTLYKTLNINMTMLIFTKRARCECLVSTQVMRYKVNGEFDEKRSQSEWPTI